MKFIICGLLFLTLSCGSKKQQAKIGFLLPNLVDARYSRDRDFFTEKVKQLGGEVEFNNAQNDANIQFTQAQQMIAGGVKVLVITAESDKRQPEVISASRK